MIICCPRVGLTLKKKDDYKVKYWMEDYRHLIYPKNIKKSKHFIILSLIK